MAISCDPNDLLTAASCIQSCLTNGQMEAIQTKLLCDIATVFTGGGGGGGSAPWVLKAGDTMTGTLMMQDASIGFKAAGGADDIFLVRDAAAILAQRNGANAQQMRWYETFTDSSNYSRTTIFAQSGGANHLIRTEAAGTGTLRILQVGTGPRSGTDLAGTSTIIHGGQSTGAGATGQILFQQSVAGGAGNSINALATIWSINTSGNLVSAGSQTLDARGGSVNATTYNIFSAGSTTGKITAATDGIIALAAGAGGAITRLAFGRLSITQDAVAGFTIQSNTGAATYNDSSTAGSGTVTDRYLWGIATPTLTATNTLITYTRASSFFIGGAPIASTNVTIGTALSLYVAGGLSRFDGAVLAQGATAIPANGTAGVGYRFSSTANFGIFFGSSTPSLSAAKGSLYLRSDGSGSTDRAYINTDGGTTWTAITTVA